MKTPTAAVLGILVALSAMDTPFERPFRVAHGDQRAPAAQQERRSSPSQDYEPVADLLAGLLGLRFHLHCSIAVGEVLIVSCRAQMAHLRGTK